MANYKVNDTELASIANAIRAKGGTSAQLEFPEEFVSAIEDISSSGGGGETNILHGSEEPLSAQGNNGDIFLQIVSSMDAALPTGYQELPAIEGTGTQYIDTSISTAQAGLSVKAKLAITGINNSSQSGGDGIWGGSWTANGYLMIRYGGVPSVFRWHYGGRVTSDAPVTINKWVSLETNDTGMIIDGITYPIIGEGANSQGTLSLFFVGSHTAGSPSKMRLGRTKVSVENTILADFVPCKNSDNEVGMYDLIGQTFYGNAGSGSFLAVTKNAIMASFLKENGEWQDLIDSDINDVDIGGGGSITPSLPSSDYSKILASAYPANYSDDNPNWGGLTISKTNNGLIKNPDFIYLRNNSFAKIDLGEPNHSFVAYFVGLVLSGDQWPVAIGTLYENSLNNSVALCSNSEKICYTHFGNTIAITSLSSIKTFVGALRIDAINKLSSCFVNGEQIAQPSSFNNSGQYCSFGAFSNSTYFSNLFIKYLAVVDGVENDSTIISNQQHLMNLYGIE